MTTTGTTGTDGMQEHIDHWRTLAQESDARAAYEEERGSSGAPHRHKAQTYRDTARSLEIERETGIAHCVCCLKPLGTTRK